VTNNSPLQILLLFAPLIFTLSCATPVPLITAIDDLHALPSGDRKAFTAIGKFHLDAGDTKGKGTILLAKKKENIKLILLNSAGGTLFALAGKDGIYEVGGEGRDNDPISRIEYSDYITIRGMTFYLPLIISSATATIPKYRRAITAYKKENGTLLTVEEPAMKALFDRKLRKIYFGDGRTQTEISFEYENKNIPAGFASTVSFEFQGGNIKIDWQKIKTVNSFPDNFFVFEE
jgi:hypothetical protein